MEEREEGDSDNNSEHEILDYLYLVDTLHYDDEEGCQFKTTRVVEEERFIVVYRKKQLSKKNGQFASRESPDTIHAKDVKIMTKSYSNASTNR